jgi:molecular chaperone DnaK
MSKKSIGIDLGSTLSEIAIIENGKPTTIVNEEGSYTTPSVIALKNGERKVGGAAKRQMVVNPKETVNLIKRFMGATFEESKEAIKHVNYEVIDSNGQPRINIEDKLYSPEELSAMILTKMKKIAEDYCGEEITDAVITVPAFFSDKARSATKLAGELAGLNVLRVIAEPTAALLSSNIDMNKGGKYMVVDFGGSTEDNSIADISDGMIDILSTNGNVYLGGYDIDNALAKWVVEDFNNENGIDLSKDSMAYSRILEAVEKAKIELSNSTTTEINLPYITVKDNTPIHLIKTVTKAKFEQLIEPIVDELIKCAKEAVKSANLEYNELDGILLVGGSCRIPYVQERLQKEFNVELIKSNNFDLCVAEGAAIQASIINGDSSASDIVLLDVTPLSYGIDTLGGVFAKIIESNTTIPCKREQVFSTAVDNQPNVDIVVAQGERPMTKDNKQVGMFRLDGILPARRGVPQIQVTFDIDANGILKVTALDKGTNKEQSITINNTNSLSQEEIDRIKREAEEFAEQDKKAKEEAETINKGDAIAFNNDKMIEENSDKISEDDKVKINEISEKLRNAVKDKNIDLINSLEKENNELWNQISTKMYSQTAQEQPQQETQTQSSENKEDNIEEASFEEV